MSTRCISLLDFCEDLDTDSAGTLARSLLLRLRHLETEHETLMQLTLVRSYVQTLRRACESISSQCPPTPLAEDHADTIEHIAGGLLLRIKLRMWFLRAAHLLQTWNSTHGGHTSPAVWR